MLRQHRARQNQQRLMAGTAWQANDLVFCTRTGTELAAGNVRRTFLAITKAAGIGENWTPRELRHSFVSILSDNGMSIEQIADLVGHKTTIVTQKVCRHQLKPVITTGATTMNTIFTETVYRHVIVPAIRGGASVMDNVFGDARAKRPA